jgi:opacity protein-like surface antigen
MKNITLSLVMYALLNVTLVAGNGVQQIDDMVAEDNQNGFYLGMGIGAVSIRTDDADMSFFSSEPGQDRVGSISLFVGYDYSQYIAFEGRYTLSAFREDAIEMDSWSIFLKPKYEIGQSDISVYGLLGFGNSTANSSSIRDIVDIDESGFQWGVGIEYRVYENFFIFVDYVDNGNDMENIAVDQVGEIDMDILTLGLIYRY